MSFIHCATKVAAKKNCWHVLPLYFRPVQRLPFEGRCSCKPPAKHGNSIFQRKAIIDRCDCQNKRSIWCTTALQHPAASSQLSLPLKFLWIGFIFFKHWFKKKKWEKLQGAFNSNKLAFRSLVYTLINNFRNPSSFVTVQHVKQKAPTQQVFSSQSVSTMNY